MSWWVVIKLDDVEQDEATAFARGVAQRSGHTVELQDEHGGQIEEFNPQGGKRE